MTDQVDNTGMSDAFAGAHAAAPMAKMSKIITPTTGAGRTRVT